jgi:hypothetical protein
VSTDQLFKNKRQAHEWLQQQGYKVSVGKFYTDCRRGVCHVNEDGSIYEAFALHYAMNQLKQTGTPDGCASPLMEEKTRLEIEHLQIKARKAQFEMEKEQGKWIPKKELEEELNIRISAFDNMVLHLLRTRMAEWLMMAGGNSKKIQIVLDTAMDNWADEMNALSQLDFVELVPVSQVHAIVKHLETLAAQQKN